MSTEPKPLALGSDHAGLALKNHLAQWLESQNIAFQDYGVFKRFYGLP